MTLRDPRNTVVLSDLANSLDFCWTFLILPCRFVAGGDSAVKLLSKFGLLEAAIDYAAENW